MGLYLLTVITPANLNQGIFEKADAKGYEVFSKRYLPEHLT